MPKSNPSVTRNLCSSTSPLPAPEPASLPHSTPSLDTTNLPRPQVSTIAAMSDGRQSRSPSPEFSPLAFDQDLTPLPVYKAACDTALDFGGLLSEPIQLREDLTNGCGGQLWPAGMVLAKHMLRYRRKELQNARMLVPAAHPLPALPPQIATTCRLTTCESFKTRARRGRRPRGPRRRKGLRSPDAPAPD